MPISDDVKDYELAVDRWGKTPDQAVQLLFRAPEAVSPRVGWGNHMPDAQPAGHQWFCTCGEMVIDTDSLSAEEKPTEWSVMRELIWAYNTKHREVMREEFNAYLAERDGPALFDLASLGAEQ